MKKTVSLAVALVLVLSFSTPSMALPGNSQGVGSGVTDRVEVPGNGVANGREVADNIGVPDFAKLPVNPPTTPPTAPGNSQENLPETRPGNEIPATLPGSGQVNNPGQVTNPGQGNAGGNVPAAPPGLVNNPVGSGLTPPGLTRILDTPAAAKNKLASGVSAECAAVLDGGSGVGCEPQTYLIRYKVGADLQVEERGLAGRLEANFTNLVPFLAAELSAADLAELARFSSVLEIEPDQIIEVNATQQNPVWGLDRIDQPTLPVSNTFSYESTGLGVDVYVVDTGVLGSHQDFSGRVTTGFSAVADGPGNGDCNGHGTHVAGTIAGTRYGVAKQATIVPVRVLGCDGSGTLSGVISGLSWIGANHDGSPAVVNLSLGSGASSSMDAATQALIDRGITVVAAAGNSTLNACQFSPARVPGVITVAASTSTDTFSSFSNSGACVDVIAPGSAVTSAYFGSNTATSTLSGTSMASPHVAGVAAGLLQNQTMIPAQVSQVITQSAVSGVISGVPVGTVNLLLQSGSVELDLLPGDGLAEDPEQSNEVTTSPVAPARPVVTMQGNTATISWMRPVQFASTLVRQSLKLYSFGELVTEFVLEPNVDRLIVEGLEYGIGYNATVTLTNEFGDSPESNQSETFRARPLQAPGEGEFSGWVKKLDQNQVKFYVKFPQPGKKIQFMVQQGNGAYRELAWIRIGPGDLNEAGQYKNLTNSVYFVRTLNLVPGKNRLRILVDGVQLGATRTYSVNP